MQPLSALAAYTEPIPPYSVREPSVPGDARTLELGDWTIRTRSTHIMSAGQIDACVRRPSVALAVSSLRLLVQARQTWQTDIGSNSTLTPRSPSLVTIPPPLPSLPPLAEQRSTSRFRFPK